jgi:hypothetical protein
MLTAHVRHEPWRNNGAGATVGASEIAPAHEGTQYRVEFSLDDLPFVIAARVRAATGAPQYLTIRRAGEWVVEALTGDRVVVMRLDVNDDGAVREHTDSFLVHTIERIDTTPEATVTATSPEQTITIPVSTGFARMLVSARRSN